ncbi:GNAT family N-acetyltransferase [Vibrio tritonius]|uniref:GNAT family N-acetyltransferase n=1 Tax=Vibrio tritonius TaxID=1435069 RepID=UPI000839669B|nr:GNAT family N-acetyltransferase [Vibrio tritonius]
MQAQIVPIDSHHDEAMCHIIKTVGAEFGAIGDGFGPSDAEVLHMSQHYSVSDHSGYFVIEQNGVVLGGGGIAPFAGSTERCELRKVFLSPQARGLGMGRQLVAYCLQFAREMGYAHCYLDTLHTMSGAIALYEKLGFEHLPAPYSGTEHNGCDVWMECQL